MTPTYTLALDTAPETEPLTLEEVKNYLKVSSSEDDNLITAMIAGVRQAAEQFMKLSMIEQSWKLAFDDYTPTRMRLPMGPVQSVTSVTAFTRDEDSTVIDSNVYYLSAGKQFLLFDTNLISQRIEIVYTTGYGSEASDIPQPLRQGMLAHIGAIYDGRTGVANLPPQAVALYKPYRILSL